jgi:hypothetical protein
VSEAGSMLKQKLSKTMRAAVDSQPEPSLCWTQQVPRGGSICHGYV